MANIKILDCTLREGGYVNDWNFGKSVIFSIFSSLLNSNVDYIEIGYLKDNLVFDIDKTLFSSLDDVKQVLPYKNNLFLMINFGEVSVDSLKNTDFGLSIAFKKKDYFQALEYCKKAVQKGFKIFINPMSINLYSLNELKYIIQMTNKIKPFALTIVDSFGSMNENEIIEKFSFINENLNNNISLSLHLHDGLNQAKSAIKKIIEQEKNREIIIQTSIDGIGRGVGNLRTQDFCDKFDCNVSFGSKTDYEMEIYKICASKNIHPNYAKFLIDNNVSFLKVDDILSSISIDFQTVFNKQIIADLI
ncbi:hypothetical protein IJX73_05665 [bacterium]|nr:hypothetical protein [bacterium]